MSTRAATRVPLSIGAIHFVGIGGIGMSGIAEIMHNLGYKVQGSDVADSANVKRLRAMGIPVAIGHAAENIRDAQVVVYSSAVKPGNAEFDAARAQNLPLVRRAEMLAEIMRLKSCVAIAGTNGKTTTTTMVAALLDAGGLDPTVVNGGIINAYGTNARLGAGDWMVVEADESDGTFLKLPADVAIVTNIDPEHLDHFHTFDAIKDAFRNFIENLPFYGFSVMCLDHPTVQEVVGRIEDRRVITYGENPQADVRLLDVNLEGGVCKFNVLLRDRKTAQATYLDNLVLPMPGHHNALNATAAITVAYELGMSPDQIRRALAGFGGVKRRFTRTGEWNGVQVFDDYGHHPVEIAAVLRAARASTKGKVVAVMQPHRFTRLQSLFDPFATCFNDADVVIIATPTPLHAQQAVGRRHHQSPFTRNRNTEAFNPHDAADGDVAIRLHQVGDIERFHEGDSTRSMPNRHGHRSDAALASTGRRASSTRRVTVDFTLSDCLKLLEFSKTD